MSPHPSHPIINSTGTCLLAAQISSLRRRQPTFDDTIDSIRDGDNRVLLALVARAQRGDADAAVTAVWALLPRLGAVVMNRLPVGEWRPGIDEYLSFAYLAIADVDTDQAPVLLADKIISRTRRRYERATKAHPVLVCEPGLLEVLGPVDNDVEERVLAMIDLDEVACAVREGLLEQRAWETLLTVRFSTERGAASARERKTASRARRRLVQWVAEAA